MLNTDWPVPFTIAHRGASQLAPENTLAALTLASQHKASWVECDVMLTKDLQPVIIHDWRLNRTTDGHGLVSRTLFNKVRSLDAGSWFDPVFSKEVVPTLSEWFTRCAELKLGLNLELKAKTKARARLLVTAVMRELKHHPYFTANNLLLSSSNFVCIAALHQSKLSFPCAFISNRRLSEKQLSQLALQKTVSIHFFHRVLTASYIAKVHAKNIRVLAYTVNDRKRAAELKALGVSGIFTDDATLFSMADY